MNDGKAATMLTDAQEGRTNGRTSGRVVLEARELRKVYGSGGAQLTILAGVNLQLAEGEMVAIVAPSGAGKSTLLHLLAALDTPTSGTVYFDAKPIDGRADAALAEFRNRAVGFVWQRHHLLPDFTAAENVALPLLLRGTPLGQALETARGWLKEAAVLLADEPTGDLDEQNAVAVFELIERLHRTHRLTSLIATHNAALAGRCDRVVGLEQGVLKLRSVGLTKGGTALGGEKS